jgi:hypothetical protein
VGKTNVIIQFNYLFIYLRADSIAKVTYRVNTDTNNKNNVQHKDNIQKRVAFNMQVLNVYIKI